MTGLRNWAHALKGEVVVLWFCTRHPRTPRTAKVLAVAVAAYALSPIDLIPDFIPVLGYLDDLLIVPAGVWLVLKMVPGDVLAECRAEAARWLEQRNPKPRSRLGAAIVIAAWIGGLTLAVWLARRFLAPDAAY